MDRITQQFVLVLLDKYQMAHTTHCLISMYKISRRSDHLYSNKLPMWQIRMQHLKCLLGHIYEYLNQTIPVLVALQWRFNATALKITGTERGSAKRNRIEYETIVL
jgi:hypothetical protein